MGKTPNMIYKILVSRASANCKMLRTRAEHAEKLTDLENRIINCYDKFGQDCIDMNTVLREFYKEGYSVDRAKIHIMDWYDLDLIWKIPINNSKNDIIVFEGSI